MVKSVPKQKKVLKVSKEKVQTSSSSSTSSSLSSLAPSSVFQCSPPLQSNGAKVAKVPLLNSDEQKMYTKHSSEIKQITALIILKSGLCLAERPSMSQIHQPTPGCVEPTHPGKPQAAYKLVTALNSSLFRGPYT
jgi:hypothetical protein